MQKFGTLVQFSAVQFSAVQFSALGGGGGGRGGGVAHAHGRHRISKCVRRVAHISNLLYIEVQCSAVQTF